MSGWYDWTNSIDGREFDVFQRYVEEIDALHEEWTREHREAGYIYLAHLLLIDDHSHGPYHRVKIGRSRDPKAREIQLKRFPVVMPMRLYVNYTFWAEDAAAVESFLHRAFARYRLDGEWFSIHDDAYSVLHDIWYARVTDGEIRFCNTDGQWRSFAGLVEDNERYLERLRTMWKPKEPES